jgi:hypothetical protein
MIDNLPEACGCMKHTLVRHPPHFEWLLFSSFRGGAIGRKKIVGVGLRGCLGFPRLRHHPESADLVPLLTVDGSWGPITRPRLPVNLLRDKLNDLHR